MSSYKIKETSLNIEKNINIAIVYSEFNEIYTKKLQEKNCHYLEKLWYKNIKIFCVPWALEIPGFIHILLEEKTFDLIIALWVVIEWETPHFHHVCTESARGIMDLNIRYKTPIINGILTCHNENQVKDRITEQYALSGIKVLQEYKNIKNA